MEALACISIPHTNATSGGKDFWPCAPAGDDFSGISNSNIGEGLMVNHGTVWHSWRKRKANILFIMSGSRQS
jgi:hypothetical protein